MDSMKKDLEDKIKKIHKMSRVAPKTKSSAGGKIKILDTKFSNS